MNRTAKMLMGAGAALGLLAALNDRMRWNVGPTPRCVEGEPHFYQWREGAIYYEVAGPADAPALLLLHRPDLVAGSYEFRRVFAALAGSYRVFLPDLLGYGRSERPAVGYTACTFVDLWSDFARDVIGRPTHGVASGLSCAHLLGAAARHGERFGKLVLVNPAGAAAPTFARQTRGAAIYGWLQLPILGMALYNFLISKAMLSYHLCQRVYGTPCGLSEAALADYYTLSHQQGAKWAPAAWLAGHLDRDASAEFIALPQVAGILRGRLLTAPAAEEAALFMALRPDVPVEVIELAGFAVAEEQPEAFLAGVRRFLA